MSNSDRELIYPFPERSAYPTDLNSWLVTVTQVRTFARQAWDLGVRYLGLCCGNRAHYTRALVEEIGRTPPASRYSPDMSQHFTQMKDKAYDYSRKEFEVQVYGKQNYHWWCLARCLLQHVRRRMLTSQRLFRHYLPIMRGIHWSSDSLAAVLLVIWDAMTLIWRRCNGQQGTIFISSDQPNHHWILNIDL